MCGRYDLSDNPAAIRAKFGVPAVPEFAPNADLRPTQTAPIVRLDRSGSRECMLARWGLVPSWAKDLKFGARCINARRETVASTPAFRSAYRQRRCLVPLNAFYEWSGPAGHKTRWRITVEDEPLFALAGLWEWWRDADQPEGPGIETYTIVTTAASAQVAPVHDRMPVIVTAALQATWLDPSTDGAAVLDAPAPRLTLAALPR
ncbi:MAG: SOS response-associated peptidase [Burkholderiaceae bacterium]|jgi:putative SOS response-associated peptidase YedK|nr:SOS response-associated peptidase [Burkholderiaceae bacterium]